MDIDGGTLPGPPPGGAGVIQMDVGDEHMPNLIRLDAVLRQTGKEARQGRPGTALHQDRALGPKD